MKLRRDHASGNAKGSEGIPGPSSARRNCFEEPRCVADDAWETGGGSLSSLEKELRCTVRMGGMSSGVVALEKLSTRSLIRPKPFAMRCVRGVMFNGTDNDDRADIKRSA